MGVCTANRAAPCNMHPAAAAVLLLAVAVSASSTIEERSLPLPFTRRLQLLAPPLNGSDVTILQHLLQRSSGCGATRLTGQYDEQTAHAVSCFQSRHGVSTDPPGVVGPDTATSALRLLAAVPHTHFCLHHSLLHTH